MIIDLDRCIVGWVTRYPPMNFGMVNNKNFGVVGNKLPTLRDKR